MEKASKSGLCHPKTKHFNPIAPPPKTSQWPPEGSRRAQDFVAGGQQFGRSTGSFSAETIGNHPSPSMIPGGFLLIWRRLFRLTRPSKTGSKLASEGLQYRVHDRGRAFFGTKSTSLGWF
ncbi:MULTISPECIES: hypothetical protein [Mesorhizobium]|uniref:hypothetical protein n=1 Tax=Mesorhizobium TaxID=68287 RepID=UPI0012DAFA5E|nr:MULTISPECIES: hypothetical protein [Mesorhizobium]